MYTFPCAPSVPRSAESHPAARTRLALLQRKLQTHGPGDLPQMPRHGGIMRSGNVGDLNAWSDPRPIPFDIAVFDGLFFRPQQFDASVVATRNMVLVRSDIG